MKTSTGKWALTLVVLLGGSLYWPNHLMVQRGEAQQTKSSGNNPITGLQSSSDSNEQHQGEHKHVGDIYQFKAKALDGSDITLSQYKGDVLLIVNTASKCGFTPQYAGLEELHKKYAGRGLKVLGFPCNQFGKQEPGDSTAIGSFCKKNYGVDFQMFQKIDVNGKDADPLYQYLTSANTGDGAASNPIKWNFTKFLIDRQGNVLKRYESKVKPEDIAPDIEKQL